MVQDPLGTMGPYAYKGNQWVSFDDQDMIRFKSEFVVRNDLGGAMIWALDLDDFKWVKKKKIITDQQPYMIDFKTNVEPLESDFTPIRYA